MIVNRQVALAALALVAGAWSGPAVAAEEKAACPPEVAQARAMIARAQEVIKAGKQGGTQIARTPQGEPASGAARGLATSAASDISPWNPRPTDKTLEARTSKARTLTAQAAKFCAAGKTGEAKAKAVEAIAVLNPK